MENNINKQCYICKFAIFDADGSGSVWLHDCKKFNDISKNNDACSKFKLTHLGEKLVYKEY